MAWNGTTALDGLRSSDLLALGMSANQVRRELHPEHVVTYELRGRAASLKDAIDEVALYGRADVNLAQMRGLDNISLDELKTRLITLRERFREVTFTQLPISRLRGTPRNLLTEALPSLQEAGLRSISADFDPAQPSLSHGELSSLLRTAASCGIYVSVSIAIGHSESLDQRVNTLELMRALQQESNVIQAVLVRVHHAATSEARREEEATAVDYLKTLAVTRLFLDNVEHLQTDWSVMGPKVLELALRFGADDAGAIPWSQAGTPEPSHHGGESELRRIIRDAGFKPVERDALFRQSLLH
jgi:cyclic dehypoxanthinyl futalosine synthase